MERFPRGTLPPKAFAAVATMAPNAVARPPEGEDTRPGPGMEASGFIPGAGPEMEAPGFIPGAGPEMEAPGFIPGAGVDPARDLDFSTTCPNCNAEMHPEHAHYKCPACGYRDSSSF